MWTKLYALMRLTIYETVLFIHSSRVHGGRVARAACCNPSREASHPQRSGGRAGITGQAPSRGSPCPGRPPGRPSKICSRRGPCLVLPNHPNLRYVLRGEVGYHVGPLVQRVAANVNSQGSPSRGMLLHGHRANKGR
jgi:hypothetical protein